MPRFPTTAELIAATEHRPVVSEWSVITQSRIDAFARATDDLQWIHTDPTRAAHGPFGTTIAHGFLTLSLLPHLLQQAIDVGGVAMHINYGLDSVRFTHVVPVDSRVRAVSTVHSASRVSAGVRVELDVIVEIDGTPTPAVRARQIILLVEESA